MPRYNAKGYVQKMIEQKAYQLCCEDCDIIPVDAVIYSIAHIYIEF